ncbi:MAG: ankyrin repeat domain-containing protein [Verrucomicrobia bacterium]|nr:ankyrin repeat domain-containing protein [Verrucomicrobiota bacterium]
MTSVSVVNSSGHFASQMTEVVRNGDLDRLREILSSEGVNCDVLLEGDLTPLYVAAELGERECVALLLDSHANPSIQCGYEKLTPLHVAAQKGHALVIQTILGSSNSSCDVLSGNGSTPLHFAASGKTLDAYHLLIEQGASTSLLNCDGLTPEAIARRLHPNEFVAEASSSAWSWGITGVMVVAALVGAYYLSQPGPSPAGTAPEPAPVPEPAPAASAQAPAPAPAPIQSGKGKKGQSGKHKEEKHDYPPVINAFVKTGKAIGKLFK